MPKKQSREEQQGLFDNDPVLANLEEVDRLEQASWPETLKEMIAVLSSLYQHEYKFSDSIAAKHARDSVTALARHFGGRVVYLPSGKKLEQAVRAKAIWEDFNGRNIPELCNKYKLSHQQIRNILEQQRANETARRQPLLPFDDTDQG